MPDANSIHVPGSGTVVLEGCTVDGERREQDRAAIGSRWTKEAPARSRESEMNGRAASAQCREIREWEREHIILSSRSDG
jgi:hypothetical protein